MHAVPFFAALLVSSCTVGPNYKRPEIALPDAWHSPIAKDAKATVGQMSAEKWWSEFDDATLRGLILRVRESNPSLERALVRIDEAWHQRRVITAGRIPHSDFNGRLDRGLGDFDDSGPNFGISDSKSEFGSVDVGWEIDLFGGRRRMIEASSAQYERQIEGWRDSLVFLTGEVALNYIDLRTADEVLALRERTSATYRQIHTLVTGREEEGVSSKIEVHEALARLRSEEAEIPEQQETRHKAQNQLARLCGTFSSDPSIIKALAKSSKIPAVPPFDSGVPAELIRSRPDVRAAERALARETAQLGVTTAELYPKFSLSGAITYEYATGASGATEVLRRTIGGGVGVVQRIFHGGADRARIAEQKAILRQAELSYNEAILRAVMEVENALAEMYFERKQLAKLSEAETAAKTSVNALHAAFEDGLLDLRDLLRAEQELAEIRLAQVFSKRSLARSSVELFKAVGGGKLPNPKIDTPLILLPESDQTSPEVGGKRKSWLRWLPLRKTSEGTPE